MNFFDHKNLGNHLLKLCPKVVKHPVYSSSLGKRPGWPFLGILSLPPSLLLCVSQASKSPYELLGPKQTVRTVQCYAFESVTEILGVKTVYTVEAAVSGTARFRKHLYLKTD